MIFSLQITLSINGEMVLIQASIKNVKQCQKEDFRASILINKLRTTKKHYKIYSRQFLKKICNYAQNNKEFFYFMCK